MICTLTVIIPSPDRRNEFDIIVSKDRKEVSFSLSKQTIEFIKKSLGWKDVALNLMSGYLILIHTQTSVLFRSINVVYVFVHHQQYQ